MNDNISKHQHRFPPSRSAAAAALAFLLLGVLCVAPALGQGQVRAMGMAGAYTASSRGLDAVDWNPANLALEPDHGLTVGLASVALDLDNNAFSLGRYNEITGAVLTEADKQELLGDIPDEGFVLDADVRASALGFALGPLALTVQGLAGGTGTMDKDFFELILMGNEIGQSFSFDDTDGEAFAVGAVTLSYATPLVTRRSYRLCAGVNARYLHGIFDYNVEEAGGGIKADMDGVTGEATASYLTSRGGDGYAVDAGLALQLPRGWTVGLAVNNLSSSLTWDHDVERRVWSAYGDSITATTDDIDAHITETDTTYAAAAYQRSLPTAVRLGASNVVGAFLLGFDLSRGIGDRAGTSETVALNVGAEWRLASWVRPRAGLGFGGDERRAAVGLGLRLGVLRWDLAVANRGQFFPNDTKGLAFASGLALDF